MRHGLLRHSPLRHGLPTGALTSTPAHRAEIASADHEARSVTPPAPARWRLRDVGGDPSVGRREQFGAT